MRERRLTFPKGRVVLPAEIIPTLATFPLSTPDPDFYQDDVFIPIGDTIDETVVRINDLGPNNFFRWEANATGVGTGFKLLADSKSVDPPTKGRITFYANGGAFSQFATSTYDGLQRIYLPGLEDNDGRGGYFEYYYDSAVWTAAFNNEEAVDIARNGSVYLYGGFETSWIGDKTKLVMRWDGTAGAAGGGSSIEDTPRIIF